MQLGIIGLPQSGKTTLYKALTKADVPTGRAGQALRAQENRAHQSDLRRHCWSGW
jgi:dephospho-CoA kinase